MTDGADDARTKLRAALRAKRQQRTGGGKETSRTEVARRREEVALRVFGDNAEMLRLATDVVSGRKPRVEEDDEEEEAPPPPI